MGISDFRCYITSFVLHATLFTVFVFFSQWQLSEQHFIFPATWCLMADICNHTWIAECGFNANGSKYKLFLDACDMYEYNCDNLKDFEVVKYGSCFAAANKYLHCPKCKKCNKSDAGDKGKKSLRRMQEIANFVRGQKRRHTPEISRLQRALNKMTLKATRSRSDPTRTTLISKALRDEFNNWKRKWNRRRTPIPRHEPNTRPWSKLVEDDPSSSKIEIATTEPETTTATTTHLGLVLKTETVVKFGHKFLKIVKKVQ